jgi:hypothetical protein
LGHAKGRVAPARGRVPTREWRLSDHLLRDAASPTNEDSMLAIERWVGGWLGQAWLAEGIGERNPERQPCLDVIGRAPRRPSPQGLAAVAALRRATAPREMPVLNATVKIQSAGQPLGQQTPAVHRALRSNSAHANGLPVLCWSRSRRRPIRRRRVMKTAPQARRSADSDRRDPRSPNWLTPCGSPT